MSSPGEFGAAIEHPTMCLRCGYELRGLAPSGVCPECGFSIAESLERRRLGLSSPAYLTSLRTGAAISIGAFILWIISGIARWRLFEFLFTIGTQRLLVGLDIAGAALLAAGVWMLAIDDPGLHEKDQARSNKRAMKAAAAGLLAIAIAELLVAWRVPPPGPGIPPAATSLFAILVSVFGGLVGLACWLTLATGLANYTRWLAARMPDHRLFRMATTMGWVLPVTFVVAFAASLLFGGATRLLPLGLMAFLVGGARARIRPDRLA